MCFHQETVLDKILKPYINDILTFPNKEYLNAFLNTLVSNRSNLFGSREQEKDFSLSILDVALIECPDGMLKHNIYRKVTRVGVTCNSPVSHQWRTGED